MEDEDSHCREGGVGHFSTRRLISPPILESTQLVLDFRRGPQRPVGDISDLLRFPPLPFELCDLRPLVHRHLERQPAFGAQRAQRQLAARDVPHEMIGAADMIDLARGVFGFPAAATVEIQKRQPLSKNLNGILSRELRGFLPAGWAAQEHGHVCMTVRDDACVLHMLGAQHHDAAAMRAHWRLAQDDPPATYHADVDPVDDTMDIPDDDTESAARRDVRGDAESNRGDGEGNDHLHPFALPVAQSLAVAPGRELDARRFADAHEVVAFPANQGDLISGCGDASLTGSARHGFDAFESVVKRGEIPASAAGTDDPEPTLPLIERDAPADTEARRSAISVKCGITERATAEHGLGSKALRG